MLGGHSATRDSEPGRRGSFGRTSSASSSIRRRSFSLSGVLPSQIDDNIESESVSEVGDIGDRALHSNRHSRSGSLRFSFDHVSENGVVIPIPEDTLSHSYGHFSHDPAAMNPVSPISPLPEELLSPISTDAMVQAENKMQNDKKEMPKLLEYSSCLTHLAVFGILGVLTRYLLQKLFGPGIAGVTSDESILYLDLPSNMVGSFLMGWFGIVFKGDISRVSDFLAIGLSTGFLGSLTTFSGWNQKMLELSVDGRWVLCILGFLIGLFLVAYSIIFGVETAKGFRRLLEKRIANQECGIHSSSRNWRVDSCERHMAVMVVCMLILGLLWSVSGVLLREKFSSDSDEAHLWFGCIVGPLGVWTRWFLARLNGRGLGKAGYLKWIPFGTLIANVSAACIMAALSTIQKASSQYREKSSPGDLVGVYRGDSYTTHETDDDIESEIVSEAGDIGDRALHSNRPSEHGSPRLSFCHGSENNRVAPPISLPRNMSFQPFSPASPLPKELASPTLVEAGKRQQIEDKTLNKKEELPKVLEYSSCLTHLAVFGILGVLTRYLLQKLFRPGAAGVTSNLSILYPDLPSNMVGSFLMGWLGVVFKPSLSRVSDFLAIGLSTGYLGSLTTFSGWNQQMVELSFEGRLVLSIVGFLIGLFLVAYSIIFGVETAKGFRLLLEKRLVTKFVSSNRILRVDGCKSHVVVMAVLLLMLCAVWILSGVYVRDEFREENGEAQLWLACIVGPFGVWMRWFLARLNGRGLGKAGFLKWIPFGTLVANVSAACLMASLSTIQKAVKTKTCDTITAGIQVGFLGCLSTVSTFIAEFNAMRESKHPWRAYAYAMITICLSYAVGILIYSVPSGSFD